MKIIKSLIAFLILGTTLCQAQTAERPDSICTHKIIWNADGKILPWYKPDAQGESYAHVSKLASEFLRDVLPKDSKTGLKLYYLFCEIDGPESGTKAYQGRTLPNNPACVFAGFTESLAVKYRIFSGDESYLQLVRDCLDYMLKNGTSPSDYVWANSPYSSAAPGDTTYEGSSRHGNGIGDGHYILEPDKVAEMGVAYLQFYQITEEKVYLEAALNCANALAKNVREGSYGKSPWPYRVHAPSGVVVEEYCSNILPAVKLFDELARIQSRINLSQELQDSYKKARDIAWKWLYSWEGPMKTFVWKGYFEDVALDHENKNRVQLTPLEIARYVMQYPEYDQFYKQNVPALIEWCNSVFGTHNALGYNAQCEQLLCMTPMGSHTARYASVCAMWYALSKCDKYKNEAYENFNWATYCTAKSGFVSVGPDWHAAWFSDGYGDYIKHFMDGLAAVPEWAPAGENHLLSSTNIVQKIDYNSNKIAYSTFMPASSEVLRLTAMPEQVTVDGKTIKRDDQLKSTEGWSWEKLSSGGVLRVKHQNGRNIEIAMR